MPNWTNNYLTITTQNTKQFTKLIQGIVGDSQQPLDFNRIIPMPKELEDSESPNNKNPDELTKKYGFPSWYEWRNANWGTKWNARDVELTLESETCVVFRFSTAWSPPISVFNKMAELYPFAEINYKYETEDGFVGEGEYSNGNLQFSDETEMTCEWRWENYGECQCETDCGICDCECGCEHNTKQTICSDCNENDHQNNNDLPQYKERINA